MSVGNPSRDCDELNDLWVVYDGECPFCSSYVLLYRVRDLVGKVHLIDGRVPHPILWELHDRRLDLDQGMVVKFRGRFYHGPEAMSILALLGSGETWFNRLNRALFRHPRAARLFYPLLVRGRLLALRVLGRKLIGEAGHGG